MEAGEQENGKDQHVNHQEIDRPVGYESRKSYARRCHEGFWDAFIAGPAVIDIGYRGGVSDAVPIVAGAVGIELDHAWINGVTTPIIYDGLHLPVLHEQTDTVYASHVLEHVIGDPTIYIQEWFRALRDGGTMILIVPHAYLYERRLTVPPSRWSPEHVRSYTPSTLLRDIEDALEPNSYRVDTLFTDDTGYDYAQPIEQHPVGCLEIVCVIRKQSKPAWKVEL